MSVTNVNVFKEGVWCTQEAMDTSSVTSASKPSTPELSSILTQVQTLQTEREKLTQELAEAKLNLSQLQEGKRAAMRGVLDTVINKWINDSVESEEAKKQFQQGMERLVTDTRETSGLWQVACAASATHAKQISELEKLRSECNELRSLQGGNFASETSRKRKPEEKDPSGFDVWSEFKYSPV
jgi:chorismate mutase